MILWGIHVWLRVNFFSRRNTFWFGCYTWLICGCRCYLSRDVLDCLSVSVQCSTFHFFREVMMLQYWKCSKCNNVFEVQRNGLLRYILYTCPNLYDNVRVDCLGAYFTHVQTYMITFVLTASVHTLHMSKGQTYMITFVLTASVHTLHMSKPIW